MESRNIVHINRRPPKNRLPAELQEDSRMIVGATLSSSGEIKKGLPAHIEKAILPSIVDAEYGTTEYYNRVRAFYAAHAVRIEYMGHNKFGKALDVTLGEDGLPLEPSDYLDFCFVRVNPRVYDPETDPSGNGPSVAHMYEVSYPQKIKDAENKALGIRKDAYKEYIKLCGNPKKFPMVYSIVFPNNSSAAPQEDKELLLEKFVINNPDKFKAIIDDPHLETRAFLMECVSAGVIRKVGSSYLDGDISLGSSLEEAILYLEDKVHSEELVTFKARLKAFKV